MRGRLGEQQIARRPAFVFGARQRTHPGRRIGDRHGIGVASEQDDEMATAEPAAQVGDRGQRAVADRAMVGPHGADTEAVPLGHARQGEQICPVTVERGVIEEVAVVEPAAVGGGDRGECSWTTVVSVPLAHERERVPAVPRGHADGA